MRIWITRAEPGAAATAGEVRKLGHEAFVAPLLEVRPIGAGPVDLAGVGALAFTSANGVRAFAGRMPAPDLPVFAVGAATARAARAAGFAQVTAADGGVAALVAAILRHRGTLVGAVLQPGATELAGDLAGALQAGGVAARTLPLYETRARALTPAELAQVPRLDVALVHSAKGAAALAAALAAHPAPQLRVAGLSAAALRPLAATPLAARQIAARPSEAALLDLLGPAA